jgi:hypothetical protein
MSILHRIAHDELAQATDEELFRALGERDTPKLFAQAYMLDTKHDCPTGGGNSLDRKTVYIDRTLYQEVMDGGFKATGLDPLQIVGLWCDHEHVEICLVDSDGCITSYAPGHRCALALEHHGLLTILGRENAKAKIAKYEETIWPALMRAYHRDPVDPPKDYWCGPLLDDATARDKELLQQLAKSGVVDARKCSKLDVRYGYGENLCAECSMWLPKNLSQENDQIAACAAVSGLVRHDRWCGLWSAAKAAT